MTDKCVDIMSPSEDAFFLFSSFQDSDLLTFNISAHHSWWSEHGPGCVRGEMPQAAGGRTTESHSYITVMGCFMDYQYIEVLHSAAQILVAVSANSYSLGGAGGRGGAGRERWRKRKEVFSLS